MLKDITAEILWETLVTSELTNDESIKTNIEEIKKEIYLKSSSDCE